MINIKTDSRKVKKGDIFVALTDLGTDGHDYIEKAIENGASMIVAEHGNYSVETKIVSNTREYLNDYLVEHYNKFLDEMVIIGITGTNGKTSATYLIAEALNKIGKKCAYIGTIGFYMSEKVCSLPNTTPDACDLYEYIMTAYDNDYRYIAIEASSHGLYLKRLCTVPFDYSAFTNLTHAHLELHKTKEEYALAKQKLFRMLKKDGVAIVNGDDPYKDYFLLEENNNETYGYNGTYQLLNYEVSNFHTYFTYKKDGVSHKIKTNLIGEYNIYNIMIPLIILDKMQVDEKTIYEVLSNIYPPVGRMEKIEFNGAHVIIDYAHTPDGVEKAMEAVLGLKPNNLYTIFCCRGRRDRTMRPLMANMAISNSKYAIMTGDNSYDEDPKQIIADATCNIKTNNYEVIWDRDKAIEKGMSLLKKGDILLILGKGHEESIVVNKERIPQNDKRAVMNYIANYKINV